MELIEALEHTFDHTQRVIDDVRADQYDDPTPCPEWTVRDLLEHTIGVVAGLGAAASGTPAAAFVLGPDPAAQFRDAAKAAIEAWRRPGVMDELVDGGPGPMPGRALASIKLPDDVARAALEASRATISPEIRPGRFGPEVSVPTDAGATDQLVAFLGRQP
jgi:hypothetical protein